MCIRDSLTSARAAHLPSRCLGRASSSRTNKFRKVGEGPDVRLFGWLSTADLAPTCVAAACAALLLSPVGARAAPLVARLRALRVVPLGPLRALLPEDQRVRFYAPRLCRSQTDSPISTDVLRAFSAESDRALLSRSGHPRSARTCTCLLYTSPSPRDRTRSRMPSSA